MGNTDGYSGLPIFGEATKSANIVLQKGRRCLYPRRQRRMEIVLKGGEIGFIPGSIVTPSRNQLVAELKIGKEAVCAAVELKMRRCRAEESQAGSLLVLQQAEVQRIRERHLKDACHFFIPTSIVAPVK